MNRSAGVTVPGVPPAAPSWFQAHLQVKSLARAGEAHSICGVLAANRWHVFAPAAGENGVWWAGMSAGGGKCSRR